MTSDESLDRTKRSGVIVRPGVSTFRRLSVMAAWNISPSMRRIVIGGEEASGFNFYRESLGPYVKLLVPPRNVADPEWPQWQADGKLIWPPAERRPFIRTYTVRDYDPVAQEITIDFVMHGDEGPASRWAARAEKGHGIGLSERGFIQPFGVDWYLFVGDHTALPAIAQSLENLPRDSKGQAFVSVPAEADRLALKEPAGIKVSWLIADPHDKTDLPLVRAMESVSLPQGSYCYFWGGAEATTARALRDLAKSRFNLPKEQFNILNYWRLGRAEGETARED